MTSSVGFATAEFLVPIVLFLLQHPFAIKRVLVLDPLLPLQGGLLAVLAFLFALLVVLQVLWLSEYARRFVFVAYVQPLILLVFERQYPVRIGQQQSQTLTSSLRKV